MSGPPPARELRYEAKLLLRDEPRPRLLAAVARHPLGFGPEFPDRQVHNVYFDGPGLPCLQEAAAGLSERAKLRLRWYDAEEPGGRATLEVKRRVVGLGWKERTPVRWEGALAELTAGQVRAALRPQLSPTQRALFDRLGVFSLYNTYRRRYLRSRDGACRLTIDDALGFVPQLGGRRLTRRRPTVLRRLCIVELKVAADRRDVLRRALQGFQQRPSRCSKYALGVGLIPTSA
jgi:hypothetical protein